jgi:hypothetical protein
MLAWSRKNAIENVTGKHVTIGSTVRAVSVGRRDHQHPVPFGTLGKVVESGKANRWSAKNALGTTDAMRIEWDLPSSSRVTNNGGPFAPGASRRD